MSYDIRVMTRPDLERALHWARDEGWNPGHQDVEAFYAADPSGLMMGFVDEEPVSSISVVKYSDSFAFLGLYIVRPKHRHKGLGKALWDAGIASAGGRTIALDGVVAQQGNYRKSGFALAHHSARWGGQVSGSSTHPQVRPLAADDLPAVMAYDRGMFPAPRPAFLSIWLNSAGRKSVGYFEAHQLRGYGTVRRAYDGWKVGPLFADTPGIAESLFRSLAAEAGSDPVVIDIPEPNTAAQEIVRSLGFTSAFETARMYRGPAPDLPLANIFGITTLELG